MAARQPAAHYGYMSASTPSSSLTTGDQPASGTPRTPWRSLLTGLLVYCSTVSISVAAAAALVSGVSSELLLASF